MVDLGLTQAGKEELALALLLWKDFKAQGKFDAEILMQLFKFAELLEVRKELEFLMSHLPPFVIKLRELKEVE